MRLVRTAWIGALLIGGTIAFAPQVHAASYRFRVRKPITDSTAALASSQVASLNAAGFRVLEDYGPFAVIEGSTTQVAGLHAATGLAFDALEDAFRVTLAGIEVDTSPGAKAPSLAPDLVLADYDGLTGLYLVQFHAPMRPAWVDTLSAAGARIVQYVGSNAYAVAAPRGVKGLQAALGGPVQYVGVFQPAFKLSPGLRAESAASVETLPTTVVLDGGQDLSAALTVLGAEAKSQIAGGAGQQRVRVSSTATRARILAQLSSVLWVERTPVITLSDERLSQHLVPESQQVGWQGPGQYAPTLSSLGLGPTALSTEIVDVLDSGVQLSNADYSATCITPDANHTGHADLNNTQNYSRLVYACPSDTGANYNIGDNYGHGSLVASIIAANPLQSGGAPQNIASGDGGYYWNLGVAPGARIGTTTLFGPLGYFFANRQSYSALANNAFTRGARYQNASFNSADTPYTADSAEYDFIVRAGGSDDVSHSMTVVFSSGNYPPLQTRSPATAKNVITVGSSGYSRSTLEGCVAGYGRNDISEFSGRGAAYNASLFKPDLVAPGQLVTGAYLSPTGGNYYDCLHQGRDPLPNTNGFYFASQGTSFSAPQVTGAAVLVRKTLGAVAPSLVKAALVASAETMYGGTDQRTGNTLGWEPTNVQGWGRLSLNRFFDGTSRVYSSENPSWAFTQAGQWRDFTLTVSDPAKPVLVALAWTDSPGTPNTPNPLVNSIGLYVYSGSNNWCDGLNYYGGQYHTPTSMCWLPPDQVNNVKMIRIAPNTFPANGQFTIHLYALNISAGPGPGIGGLSQDWSAYVYNAR